MGGSSLSLDRESTPPPGVTSLRSILLLANFGKEGHVDIRQAFDSDPAHVLEVTENLPVTSCCCG
jgi:hypothetical protein